MNPTNSVPGVGHLSGAGRGGLEDPLRWAQRQTMIRQKNIFTKNNIFASYFYTKIIKNENM
jgi:hypothetical protein